ncbi:MAG TPA: PEGA domain-containing protein [Patescibacteria group bacterium]
MTKIRVLIFLSTLLVVGVVGLLASYYARGYRFDQTLKLNPSGLFVANSDPTGAQVFVNGELKTATNATINLAPGTYDVTLKKEGYLAWSKRMIIEKEIVTQIDVHLFRSASSLSAVTFSGAFNPQVSPDLSKVAYGVPTTADNADRNGLWVLETINLPLGFNRDPRRITDGDLTGATWKWSPDSREILLTTKAGVFLLDASTFTSQNQRVNIASSVSKTISDWNKKEEDKLTSLLGRLPDELDSVFARKAKDVVFSPDENKFLYTASDSANIPEGLIKALPGSSNQKETRDIKKDHMYVFDIKEDRNFEVADSSQIIYWYPSSANLVVPQKDQVIIMDYDGTNKQTVWGGSYISPNAFPTPATNRILILTNLGAQQSVSNLYSLNLK